MLLSVILGLNPAVHTLVASWWAAADSPTDPTSVAVWLGPFAAAAAFALLWIRDLVKSRDRMLDGFETQGPILTEIRDALRTTAMTNQAATKAIEAMAEAMHRIPSEAEVTRLRDALQGAQAQPPHPWRT